MIETVDAIVRQPGHPERVVRLQPGATRMGRAEDNEIVLSDVGVSRRHAQIHVGRGEVNVEDLGSGNGTYYNGYRIQTQALQNGDEVVIDPFVIQFRITGHERPSQPPRSAGGEQPPARLEVVVGTGMAGSSYPITSRGLSIGRSEDRDVVIPDPASSRHHCQISSQDGEYVLRDMGSANGVYVNAVRIRECTLADGDLVRIGNTEMRFVRYDQGVSDTTTQVVPSEVWNQQAGDPVWGSAPAGGTIIPQDAPAPRSRRTRSVLAVLVGGTFAFGILLSIAVVIGVAALVIYTTEEPPPPIPAKAPSWSLQLPPGLESASANALFDQGVAKMREADRRGALQDFYRVLKADPGNRSAEKFAFAAGELLVLDALQGHLQEQVEARRSREAERDRLLRDMERGGRAARFAEGNLRERFREDPVVMKQLGWPPTDAQKAVKKRTDEAAEALANEKYVDAAARYVEVLNSSTDPTVRKAALAGLKVSQREVARIIAGPWRQAVLSEALGDPAARQLYEEMKSATPANASIRRHLAQEPD